MTTLLLGLLLFLGIHSFAIVAPGHREAIVRRLGPWAWKGLYSVVAIVGFVLIVRGYASARPDPVVLYTPPAGLRHVAALLLLPAFPMLLAACGALERRHRRRARPRAVRLVRDGRSPAADRRRAARCGRPGQLSGGRRIDGR
jgi:uncharacterized membrane protein